MTIKNNKNQKHNNKNKVAPSNENDVGLDSDKSFLEEGQNSDYSDNQTKATSIDDKQLKQQRILAARGRNDNTYAQDKSIEQDQKAEEEKAKKFLKAGFFSKLPAIVRSILVKFWFSAAVFFFVAFGTVNVTRDNTALVIAMGLIIGLMTDFIITPFLKMCDGVKKDAYKYNLFDIQKKNFRVLNLVLNLLYAVALCFLVVFIYAGINIAINAAKGYESGTVTFMAEPILFGVFFMIVDLAVLSVRNLVVVIINKLKNQ